MKNIALSALASLFLLSCGRGGNDDKTDPPPVRAGDATAELFAVESGNYIVERVWNLNDGCNRNPLDPRDPITSVNYALTNNGQGSLSLERCVFEGRMAQGQIQGNRGTLAVSHSLRRDEVGSAIAQYQQDCTLEVRVTANNSLEIQFLERQSGRDATMKSVTDVNADECSTSYTMLMKKKTP